MITDDVYNFSGKRILRCVVEAGIKKHGKGTQCGDDDKEPKEKTI